MFSKGRRSSGHTRVASSSEDAGAGGRGAVNRHTWLVLSAVILLAFVLRIAFAWGPSTAGGFFLSGGPDAAYHKHTIEHILATGKHLVFDPLLNYPLGLENPNPPLMDWSVTMGGLLLALGGLPVHDAAMWSLLMHSAVLGALACIPVFLIARDAFGRRAGVVAALLYAVSAGAISGSVMSNGDHDTFVMFFILWALYFLMVALRRTSEGRYVESYRSRDSLSSGLRDFLRSNKLAMAYAMMAGVCLAAVEMAWKGFTYVTVIVIVYLFVQILIDRFTGRDSLAVTLTVSVMLFTGLILGAPCYFGLGMVESWYDIPILMAVVALLVGVAFSVTRDRPWLLVLPAFVLVAALSVLALWALAPGMLDSILSGQGYFGYDKVYSTIAEAQSPGFSRLATDFGWLSIWLSFAGLLIMLMRLPKERSPERLMITVWLLVAVYMAASASRFIFNAAPAFAIAAAMALVLLVERADIPSWFREIRSAGFRGAWRRVLKPLPLFTVLGAVLLVMAPNVLFAVDASMPYNSKADYDRDIYDAMPSFLRPDEYDGYRYLGASGYQISDPRSAAWLDAWSWLASQDTDLDPADRPGFLSWWDYGHEASAFGLHPAVADNFQSGYQIAGNFFTAQSEEESIALLIARCLETGTVPDSLFTSHGLDAVKIKKMLKSPEAMVSELLADSERYGLRSDDLSAQNALYVAVSHYLCEELDKMELVELYSQVRAETGADIRYVGIDHRMFPLFYGDGNIMPAMALLADRPLDAWGAPEGFYEYYAQLASGSILPMAQLHPSDRVVDIHIVQQQGIQSSMLWRLFAGFSDADIGADEQGIPGVIGGLKDQPHMPAWNLSNYRAVYSSAYYNPYDDYAKHQDAWERVSLERALELAQLIEDGELSGVVDITPISLMRDGVMLLQYYDGVIISGNLRSGSDLPLGDVRVTVMDEYGIPHMSVLSDENGYYEILAPFGDVELVFSRGAQNPVTLIGEKKLATETFTFSVDQAMRLTDYEIDCDLTIPMPGISGILTMDVDGSWPLEGAEVRLEGEGLELSVLSGADGGFSFPGLAPGDYQLEVLLDGRVLHRSERSIADDDLNIDIGTGLGGIEGVVSDALDQPLPGLRLQLTDLSDQSKIELLSSAEGRFQFSDLMPGDYRLDAIDGSDEVIFTREIALEAGATQDADIRIEDLALLYGSVSSGANPVAGAAISALGSRGTVTVFSAADGSYEMLLPFGEHSLYTHAVHGEDELAALRIVNINGKRSLDIALEEALILSGHALKDGASVKASIAARDQSGAQVVVSTSASGQYRLALPAGDYQLLAQAKGGALWTTFSADTRDWDLSLASAHSVSGNIWYDANGDGTRSNDEGVGPQYIDVISGDRRHRAVSNADGTFDITLPSGKAYTLRVSAPGFQQAERSFNTLRADVSGDIELLPTPCEVSGMVALGGTAQAVNIEFKAITVGTGSDAQSAANGQYSVDLVPGNYRAEVRHEVSASLVLSASVEFEISLGQSYLALDLDLEEIILSKLYTDSDRNRIFIEGQDVLSGSLEYELELPAGVVSVYLVNDAEKKANLISHDLTNNPDINIFASDASRLSGSLLFEGEAKSMSSALTIVKAGATHTFNISGSSYRVLLPDGTYTLKGLNQRLAEDDGAWEYSSPDSSITISGGDLSEDIILSRTAAKIELDVLYSNLGAVDLATVSLEFHQADSVKVFSGDETIELSPGVYTVLVYEGERAWMGALSLGLKDGQELEVTFRDARVLSGRVHSAGLPTVAELKIQQGDVELSGMTDAEGRFNFVLPRGHYVLEASASRTENGMDVSYSSSLLCRLQSNLDLPLNLERQDQRSIEIINSALGELIPGQAYSFSLTVQNIGDSAETVRLSSNGWKMDFSQQNLVMGFGSQASSVTLQGTLHVPLDALVDHGDVKVYALGEDGSRIGAVTLDFSVKPHHGLSLEMGEPKASDGSDYRIPILVSNKGNVDETFALDLNYDELSASGWDAYLVDAEGDPIDEVSVKALKVESAILVLIPGDGERMQPQVTLTAASGSDTEYITFYAPLPQAAVGADAFASGPDVHDGAGEMPSLTWFLMGAVVLATLMFIMMGMSRGVFSRKKR